MLLERYSRPQVKDRATNSPRMRVIVQQTQFYKTPEAAIGLFSGEKFRQQTMPHVVDFCISHGITEGKPSYTFGAEEAQLTFTSEFITGIREGIQPDAVK